MSDDLVRLLEEFLGLYKICFGAEYVRPKFHWCFDVAEQLRCCTGHLMDAFVIERLHIRARSVADHVSNTRAFDVAVCTGVLNGHAKTLQSNNYGDDIIGAYGVSQVGGLQQASVGDAMRWAGRFLERDAVVARSDGAMAIVTACVTHDAGAFVAVTLLEETAERSSRARYCKLAAGPCMLWPAEDVEQCLAWQRRPAAAEYIVIAP